jgi:thiamine biosynthesis lipoprotein
MRHPFPSKRLRIALGTWVAIEARGAAGPDGEVADETAQAIDAAYAAISAVEARMHPSRPGSDLAQINAAPLDTPIQVQPDTWQVLELAQRLYRLTDGIFDPCLPTHAGRLQDLEISSKEPLLICHAPVQLDLGGIAKGHAIDRAIEKLRSLGCTSGLVNAGGDLRVFGDRQETILLRRGAGTRAYFRPFDLANAALAVSDLDAVDWPAEHHGYYSRVGPITSLRYAAVVAKDAVTADALTKCVLLCPIDTTERVLRELDARSV